MADFFRQGDAKCVFFERVRDVQREPYPRAKVFIQALWDECEPFVDLNAQSHAMQDLPSVFWELYLAHALRKAGVSLVPQPRTKKRQRGPDLRSENPEVWIEAITPTAGTGADAMESTPLGVCYDVPVQSFILRLRSAIKEKAGKMAGYINDGVIPADRPAVIAISSCLLPTNIQEQPHVPRIVRAVFAVGNLVLEIDPTHRRATEMSVEHRDAIANAKGASIRTDVFLDPAFAHISALIYSYQDWVNIPKQPGAELVVVHNPLATNPLPDGWLPVGKEYWWHNDAVRSAEH